MALSLSSLRSRVKVRYARSGTSGDTPQDLLDLVINYSLREIYNTLGDNAWFLRKTGSITVNGSGTTTTLPPNMKRLYRIEVESTAAGYDIDFTVSAFDDDLAIVVLTNYSGDVTAHFLDIPVDLVSDTDTAALPDEHVELVVVLACKRLAESVANVRFSMSLTADLPRLWQQIKRDCLRYEGQRHEGLRSPYFMGHPSF